MANWIKLDFDDAHLAAAVLQLLYGDKRIDHTKVKISASLGNGDTVEKVEKVPVTLMKKPRVMRAAKKGKELTARQKQQRPFDREALKKVWKTPGFTPVGYARKVGVSDSLVQYHLQKLRQGKPSSKVDVSRKVDLDDLRKAMKEEGFNQSQYAKKTGISISAVFRAVTKVRGEAGIQKARQRLAPEA